MRAFRKLLTEFLSQKVLFLCYKEKEKSTDEINSSQLSSVCSELCQMSFCGINFLPGVYTFILKKSYLQQLCQGM